jgi:hypothetical protein
MNFEPTEDYKGLIEKGNAHRKREPTKVSNQFVRIAFNNINDHDWRVKHRSPLAGYLYIASKVYRKVSSADTYDLYHRFYLDNKIAAAPSLREMAEAFGYGDNTKPIRKWIETLLEEGAFIIEKIDVGKPKPANVYIVGEFQAKKEFLYYGNIRGV